MGQSLVKNYLHIIFSTRDREPIIDSSIESELHQYLGGICKGLDCQSLKIGGACDHIHILCLLSKNITLAAFMKDIKSNSSKWIKTKGNQYRDFFWQTGYGAFSINPAQTDAVISYIANQHEHHRKKSFKEEYLTFLKKYDVAYDEQYLWD